MLFILTGKLMFQEDTSHFEKPFYLFLLLSRLLLRIPGQFHLPLSTPHARIPGSSCTGG